MDTALQTSEPAAPPPAQEGGMAAVTKTLKQAKAGKGKTGKAVAVVTSKSGEVVAPGDMDKIEALVHEVENIKEEKLYSALQATVDDSALQFFRLGGLFTKAQEQGWFHGHADFKSYVETECSFSFRTAVYASSTYKALVTAGISFTEVKGIGLSKLKEIAPILTKTNVQRWVNKASKLTTLELAAEVRKAKAKSSGESNGSAGGAVASKTFKLHADQQQTLTQAIDKAKKAVGTEVDTVALEAMAAAYLAGPDAAPSPKASKAAAALGQSPEEQLRELIKSVGWNRTLEITCEIWPDLNIDADASKLTAS